MELECFGNIYKLKGVDFEHYTIAFKIPIVKGCIWIHCENCNIAINKKSLPTANDVLGILKDKEK